MKILSRPKGNAEEYGRWSVNPYVGCPHGCSYCYLKKGVWKNTLGGTIPALKTGLLNEEHAYHVAMAEIIENREQIIRDGGLFMTFTSDPFINETRNLFLQIIRDSVRMGIPVTTLTKCGEKFTVNGYTFPLLNNIRQWMSQEEENLLAFGITLTGQDELEPNASSNEDRINLIRKISRASNCHFHTWASIEPVIDFESSLNMIKQALDAGCTHFKIGLLTNNTRVCRNKYDLQQCLSFIGYVMRITADRATVYWKQSVRDFIGPDLEWHFDIDIHSVGKDYNIFNNQ